MLPPRYLSFCFFIWQITGSLINRPLITIMLVYKLSLLFVIILINKINCNYNAKHLKQIKKIEKICTLNAVGVEALVISYIITSKKSLSLLLIKYFQPAIQLSRVNSRIFSGKSSSISTVSRNFVLFSSLSNSNAAVDLPG